METQPYLFGRSDLVVLNEQTPRGQSLLAAKLGILPAVYPVIDAIPGDPADPHPQIVFIQLQSGRLFPIRGHLVKIAPDTGPIHEC